MTEILILKNDSAESLFDKLHQKKGPKRIFIDNQSSQEQVESFCVRNTPSRETRNENKSGKADSLMIKMLMEQ